MIIEVHRLRREISPLRIFIKTVSAISSALCPVTKLLTFSKAAPRSKACLRNTPQNVQLFLRPIYDQTDGIRIQKFAINRSKVGCEPVEQYCPLTNRTVLRRIIFSAAFDNRLCFFRPFSSYRLGILRIRELNNETNGGRNASASNL